MAEELIYYKRNVRYPVGVRMFIGDSQGRLLKDVDPYIAVRVDKLRDFKLANKFAILNGYIVQAEEPSVDWETANSLTVEDMNELLKNFLKLKSSLQEVTSIPILEQLLDLAKEQNKSNKTIKLIEARLAEFDEHEKLDWSDLPENR